MPSERALRITVNHGEPVVTVLARIPGVLDDKAMALSEGYYWDTKHGRAVAGIKMLIGTVLGKTLDDSIEGKIAV